MQDICVVTEGGWPARTGGIATWTQHLATALSDFDIGVVSLPAQSSDGAEFEVPRNVRTLAVSAEPRRLPEARVYLASGLHAAERVAAWRPALVDKMVYVEHGDLVSEMLAGAPYAEGGSPLPTGGRAEHAADAARRRRVIRRACRSFVSVTPRAARRAIAEGAGDVRAIPNAVPPPTASELEARAAVASGRDAAALRAIAFVGRFAAVKGFDRFVALSRRVDGNFRAVGIPVDEALEPFLDHPFGGLDLRLGGGHPWASDVGVLVLPSRLEACPFAALEAESRGITAIVSDVAELAESPLLLRAPWDLDGWATLAARSRDRGIAPRLGARLAAERWERFRSAWRATLAP